SPCSSARWWRGRSSRSSRRWTSTSTGTWRTGGGATCSTRAPRWHWSNRARRRCWPRWKGGGRSRRRYGCGPRPGRDAGPSLAEPERRAIQVQERMLQQLLAGLQHMMEQLAQAHAARLAALEQQSVQGSNQLLQQMASLAAAVRDTGREQQAALARVAEGIAN